MDIDPALAAQYRLDCLRAAQQGVVVPEPAADVVARARIYSDFVLGTAPPSNLTVSEGAAAARVTSEA